MMQTHMILGLGIITLAHVRYTNRIHYHNKGHHNRPQGRKKICMSSYLVAFTTMLRHRTEDLEILNLKGSLDALMRKPSPGNINDTISDAITALISCAKYSKKPANVLTRSR